MRFGRATRGYCDSVMPNDVAKGLNQLSLLLGRAMPNSNSLVLSTFKSELRVLEKSQTVHFC